MLSRVFGSTADEANALKLEFRSSLPRLAESPIPTHDSRFWRQASCFLSGPQSLLINAGHVVFPSVRRAV